MYNKLFLTSKLSCPLCNNEVFNEIDEIMIQMGKRNYNIDNFTDKDLEEGTY